MQQSSSFQLLVWSFSPFPSEILPVKRGCIWAGTSLTGHLCAKKPHSHLLSVSSLCAFAFLCGCDCVFVRVQFFVSHQALQARESLWEQLGNQTVILSSTLTQGLWRCPEPKYTAPLCQDKTCICMQSSTHMHTKESSTCTDCIMHFRSFHHLGITFIPGFSPQTNNNSFLMLFIKMSYIGCYSSSSLVVYANVAAFYALLKQTNWQNPHLFVVPWAATHIL